MELTTAQKAIGSNSPVYLKNIIVESVIRKIPESGRQTKWIALVLHQ